MVPGLHFRPLHVLFTSCTFSSLHCPGFLSIVSDPSLFLSFFWPMVLPLCLLCSLPVDLSFTHLESYTALHFYCPVTCTKPFWCLRAHVSPVHLDVTIFEDMPAVTLGASEISVLGALRKQLTFVWDRQSRVQCLHSVYLWEMAFWVCLSIIQAWWMFLHLPRVGIVTSGPSSPVQKGVGTRALNEVALPSSLQCPTQGAERKRHLPLICSKPPCRVPEALVVGFA